MTKRAEELHAVPLTLPGRNFHMKRMVQGQHNTRNLQYFLHAYPNYSCILCLYLPVRIIQAHAVLVSLTSTQCMSTQVRITVVYRSPQACLLTIFPTAMLKKLKILLVVGHWLDY